jgi:hypothetical protein
MSMEISVLSDKQLTSATEWQTAIDAKAFPLRLSYDKPLAQLGGMLPVYLSEKRTAFECHHREPSDIFETYNDFDFGHAWKYNLAFISGVNFDAMLAAWMAATAYAAAVDGIVFNEEEGKLLRPTECIETIREIERSRPEFEAAIREFMQQLQAKS